MEFVDLLRDIAEGKHLDLCVDDTFAGTEEAAEEADASDAIDAVVAEEDRGDDFDAVKEADAEAELPVAMPLPGMSKTERELREKYRREHALLVAGCIETSDNCPRTVFCTC